jgi:hypothetical protein
VGGYHQDNGTQNRLAVFGQRSCPLLAQSGHHDLTELCPLSGVKQTLIGQAAMSVRDPKGTSGDPVTVVEIRGWTRLPGSDRGLYRSHTLIIPSCVDYDTNRVFGHREGAYVASSWEL